MDIEGLDSTHKLLFNATLSLACGKHEECLRMLIPSEVQCVGEASDQLLLLRSRVEYILGNDDDCSESLSGQGLFLPRVVRVN